MITALLVPGASSAAGRCDRQPQNPACRFIEKRKEVNDKRKGVTPACRAAFDARADAVRMRKLAQSGLKEYKAALKKAKSKKAKAKNKKGVKQFKKLVKKRKKQEAKRLAAQNTACQGSNLPS